MQSDTVVTQVQGPRVEVKPLLLPVCLLFSFSLGYGATMVLLELLG